MPRLVVAGGTGFLGQALITALRADDRLDIVVLTRGAHGANASAKTTATAGRLVTWAPNGDIGPWAAEIDGATVLVNLAGESLAARRWTLAHKARILESRLAATRSLVAAIARAASPPPTFISQSAIGYYGPHGDEVLADEAQPGSDFLATVCVRWEAEAARAATDRTRVVCLRTGLVLARHGGPLPPMLPPFWFGAGGPIGSGRQYWSWIHLADWVALVQWVLREPVVRGAVNATAPAPVTNREFARALGRAIHRPAFMPAPAFAIRLILGEMAGPLVLTGQRVVPTKAERLGFTFRYTHVDEALAAVFER